MHVFVCVHQDVCGATDTREQPVDVGGAGRLRLLQTVPTHHHGAQGSQVYPLVFWYSWRMLVHLEKFSQIMLPLLTQILRPGVCLL